MGSTNQDVANIKLINTDVDGKLNINVDATTQQILTDILAKQALIETNNEKIEINANKASSTNSLISTPTTIGINGDVGLAIDLGVDENRYRNIVFRGEVDVSVNTDPKIIMSYSDDNTDYHSDGTFASFYKKTPTTYEFCFQRSNIGLRYVKLVAQNSTTFNYVKTTISKY